MGIVLKTTRASGRNIRAVEFENKEKGVVHIKPEIGKHPLSFPPKGHKIKKEKQVK